MQLNPRADGDDAGCGARLRQGREAAGLSREDISVRLKVPARVIAVLESDDWSSLGAPVFVRGQLRSYARLLALDVEDELARIHVASVSPAELVSHTHTPRFIRVAEQIARRAVYIAVTAAIAVPVWMATSPHLGNNALALQSLDIPASVKASGADTPARPTRTPLVASFTSLPRATPAVAPALFLRFHADSWVQVFAADGRALEQGVLKAGQSRTYAAGEVGRVVLGNSSTVKAERAGKPIDLAPFSRANVARFTLSSDGSLSPSAY